MEGPRSWYLVFTMSIADFLVSWQDQCSADGLSMQKLFFVPQHLIHVAEDSLPLGFPAIKTAILPFEYTLPSGL